jgi:UDP-2,3-diacylglucosamine pyrophosphatase LpxH
MIVVISDLHFEEVREGRIDGAGGAPEVVFERNLNPRAFIKLKENVIDKREQGHPLDVVLAGDIFDIHRTALWFKNGDGIRPFDDPAAFAPGSPGEAKVLGILEKISEEPNVKGSLDVIRSMADSAGEARIHYLPGNHDRLANATPAIRSKVRELLGLGASPDPFPHRFSPTGGDPPVLVRHGHEYDRFNFSADHGKGAIALDLPEAEYSAPAFGDFMTVEVASQLPVLFRKVHTDATIVADPVLRALYIRLLEFDDVRPQSALVEFLLRTPGLPLGEKGLWRLIEPVVRELLEAIGDAPFLTRWLKKLEKHYQLDTFDWVQLALKTKIWKAGLPLPLIRRLAGGSRDAGQAASDALLSTVAREQALKEGGVRAVIAGHTHDPQVALLDRAANAERYYIDTGTWRNRVPATPDAKEFGRLKALTYVVAYGNDEDLGKAPTPVGKLWSFDYWSGFTQHW